MGFWSSLRSARKGSGTTEPSPASTPVISPPEAPPLSDALSRLLALGSKDGPLEAEALGLLASLRVSDEEGLALDGLVRLAHERPLPDGVVLAAAAALIDWEIDRPHARCWGPPSRPGPS